MALTPPSSLGRVVLEVSTIRAGEVMEYRIGMLYLPLGPIYAWATVRDQLCDNGDALGCTVVDVGGLSVSVKPVI